MPNFKNLRFEHLDIEMGFANCQKKKFEFEFFLVSTRFLIFYYIK